MTKKQRCNMRECLSTHRRELVGAVFLILATLLTLLTLSGLGIFGMFITGLILCSHKHLCCSKDNGDKKPAPKPPAARKTTTKASK